MRTLRIWLGVICILFLASFIAIEDPFKELIKKLEEYAKKYPQEKVHLQLDKPYYAIGDNIWFKAYVKDSRTGALTTLSKILYVELIDEQDSLRKQLKLPMELGLSWSDISLSDTLPEGNYRIRAYTQLMRNAGSDFFFEKNLKIANSWANKVFVNTNYQLIEADKKQKVAAKVQILDKQGSPYKETEVSFVSHLDGKIGQRGKTTTNDKGEIEIPVSTNSDYRSGILSLTIQGPDKKKINKTVPVVNLSSDVDLQFFPESGNFIIGLPNKVAFKATNQLGKGVDVTGVIIDNNGNQISTLESTHLGMGSVYLNPSDGTSYQAIIKLKNGVEKKVSLPKAEKSGHILTASKQDSVNLGVRFYLTNDLINTGDLHILAQQNGSVYFSAKFSSAKNAAYINLPVKELPTGLITLTLFNSTNIPVAERLVFIDNKLDKIELNPLNLKGSYGKREEMNLNFSSSNNGKPVQGSFSVAITNASKVNPEPDEETNILASLLLKSELRGYIEKPNFYFSNQSSATRNALDHLILTQGWRKINWKTVSSGQLPDPEFPVETDLRISGLVATNGGKPIVGGKVSIFSSSSGIFAMDTLTDANGRFSFDEMEFPDMAKFVVQARNEKGKRDVLIKLDVLPKQLTGVRKGYSDIEINVNQSLNSYLENTESYFDQLTKSGELTRTIQLEKVEIVGAKKPIEFSANLNGPGNADQIITAKDLESAISISQYLYGRVSGLTIKNNNAYLRAETTPMLIVLDGMQMQDFSLADIEPMNVESVEVLKYSKSTIYGSAGKSGVLVITTKRGGSTGNIPAFVPGVITFSAKGLTASREFYSAKHHPQENTKLDLRSTIYWKPNLISDEKGQFSLNYFNADEPGTYRVVIEGVDISGNLGRTVFNYEVK